MHANPNGTVILRFMLIILLCVYTSFFGGCKKNDLQIKYYVGCTGAEAEFDYALYYDLTKDYFIENQIEVLIIQSQDSCGYSLVKGKQEMYLSGVHTDVDLVAIANEFYGLK